MTAFCEFISVGRKFSLTAFCEFISIGRNFSLTAFCEFISIGRNFSVTVFREFISVGCNGSVSGFLTVISIGINSYKPICEARQLERTSLSRPSFVGQCYGSYSVFRHFLLMTADTDTI